MLNIKKEEPIYRHRVKMRQVLVSNLKLIAFFLLGAIMCMYVPSRFEIPVFVCFEVVSFILFYNVYYMLTMEYIFYPSQIERDKGVFSRTNDFLKIYRIVDYREKRSFLQRIFRLKNVLLITKDTTDPNFEIIGLNKKDDIIPLIGELSKSTEKQKSIHEILNS